ncbi:Inner membrane protein YjgN [Pandoraea terrae]|uniref:Inner membrane protein YjgN n=2 Tax=Pandoraea terrae TaxID=1537710 RepID=A0A5E4TSM1_9BURK|nr:Inner membrane protein YjgN [Pandoraea terrae]
MDLSGDRLPQPQPAGSVQNEMPFTFTGSGASYFRIWIVNGVLSLLTLGIYSAWAKVRRLQYFYRNTQVDGAAFDYHGTPWAILKGRIIAIVLFMLYSFAGEFSKLAGGLVLLALIAIMPWLLWNSLRFRLYNSSYRGIRFAFRGSLGGAYGIFLGLPVLALFTLYLAAPFAHCLFKRYQHNGSALGNTRFSFHGRASRFYLAYVACFAIVAIITVIVGTGLLGLFSAVATQAKHTAAFAYVIGFYVGLLAAYPVFSALILRCVWNDTRLGEHRFVCRLSVLRFLGIHYANLLLTVITLGLYRPFAKVRVTRYLLSTFALIPSGSLDAFTQSEADAIGAAGEEAAGVFDIDIAL